MITCTDIVDKFCSGPVVGTLSEEAIAECRECTTLEDLVAAVDKHMDFDSFGQASLFVINYLDYEID